MNTGFNGARGGAAGKRRLFTPLLVIGLGAASVVTFRHAYNSKPRSSLGDEFDKAARSQITLSPDHQSCILQTYMQLPWRSISRAWGHVNGLELPRWARRPLYSLYSWAFDVRLDEVPEPLNTYPNLGAFFYRKLKPGTHVIEDQATLVSPADARVLDFGQFKTSDEAVAHVKGITYSQHALLGNALTQTTISDTKSSQTSSAYPAVLTQSSTKLNSKSSLYYIVLYLAPGDYHRFHAPADVEFHTRRHIPGMLLSVSPSLVSRFPNVLSVNERVALLGRWKHGFFGFVPVGATNVGSIYLNAEPDLTTNLDYGEFKDSAWCVREASYIPALQVHKGDELGGFKLGSTVVLVFEVPEGPVQFTFGKGEKVRVGQSLISIDAFDQGKYDKNRVWWQWC